MGQVPQCTGRLCWEIKYFSNQYSCCLSSISICNLLIDLPSYFFCTYVHVLVLYCENSFRTVFCGQPS
jgi:hypothetical protein